jgi:hypothetical protein
VDQIEPRIFELDAVSATVRQLHSKVHGLDGMPLCAHPADCPCVCQPCPLILAALSGAMFEFHPHLSACLLTPQVERMEPRVDDADTVGEAQRQSDKALRQLHSKVRSLAPSAQRCCWPFKTPVQHST